DLRRFLAREPVQARPVRAWERTVKWARRHPARAALAVGSAGAVLGLLVGALWHAEQMRTARGHAEQEGARAKGNFEAALRAVDQMLTEVGHKRLAHLPRLAEVRRRLLQDALTFYQQFVKEDSTNPAVRREAAQAAVRLGRIHELLGQHADAEQVFLQARALQEELRAASPDMPDY